MEFMSPDSVPPDIPFGDSPLEPGLADALGSIRALAAGRFTVLGPIGRDIEGNFAFLARELSADRIVVLKNATAPDPDGRGTLKVIRRLDASVPPPAGTCPVCRAPFVGWDPSCPDCGEDLAGSRVLESQGVSPDELLVTLRDSAQGYEVLGQMPRAVGGAPVYFARELPGGSILALRLDAETSPGRRSGFTVATTRMMRPRLLYGSVGSAPRESGSGPTAGSSPWSPVPSPPPSLRPVGSSRPGASAALSGHGGGQKTCPQCHETFSPELRFCPKDGSALRASEPSDDLVGQVIAERYHIMSKLGEGGMGRVYLAEHVRMGRRCAIKVMHSMLLYDPDSVSRFNREAANASGISHPNVAAIYDFGESDGLLYLAMELVQGESLSALLARGPAFTESRVIDIALQVVDALGAAHELGIVHRDLKPDNIMVSQSRDGRDVVKVVDFGIAKATKRGQQTVTRTGFIVGTPAYMSPEQILGDPVDGRSDLYSLGCILYEMLTGERAFLDADGEISLRQRLTQPPPQPRRVKHGLSGHLNSLVTTALARDPEQRFQSATQVRDALIEAKNAVSAVSWRKRLPWRRSPKPTLTTATPSPLPARSQEQHGETAPTAPDVGEDILAAPQGSLQRRTVVRPRSAMSPAWNPAWLVAGFALTALLGFGVWRLLSPTSPQSTETATADSQIILPATETPPREAATAPVATPAKDSATTGTFRFAARLPADATLMVDGARVTLSQDNSLSLAPGRHLLRVEAPGYQPYERPIDIAAGKTEVTKARLLPIKRVAEASPDIPTPKPAEVPATGTIVFAGELPESAEVSLDGVTQPAGVREMSAAPGSHWLKLSAPGFQPDSSQVEVTGGETSPWEIPALTAIPTLVTVVLGTPDTTIPVGAIVQLRARARDDRGSELGDSLVWESSNGEMVGIDRRGRATGRSPGRAYIRASMHDHADSILVTVVAPPPKPKPVAVVPRPPAPVSPPRVPEKPAGPVAPTGANIQAAVNGCAAALSSGDKQRIVDAYQPKTAQDSANLRKIMQIASRGGTGLAATATAVSAASTTAPVGVDARVHFTWRNNMGVNKKKDTPFRVELNKGAAGWELAACRATEKVAF